MSLPKLSLWDLSSQDVSNCVSEATSPHGMTVTSQSVTPTTTTRSTTERNANELIETVPPQQMEETMAWREQKDTFQENSRELNSWWTRELGRRGCPVNALAGRHSPRSTHAAVGRAFSVSPSLQAVASSSVSLQLEEAHQPRLRRGNESRSRLTTAGTAPIPLAKALERASEAGYPQRTQQMNAAALRTIHMLLEKGAV